MFYFISKGWILLMFTHSFPCHTRIMNIFQTVHVHRAKVFKDIVFYFHDYQYIPITQEIVFKLYYKLPYVIVIFVYWQNLRGYCISGR